MSSFLAMGGYAAYVWPAYAAAFGAVGVFAWRCLTARARARRLVARLEAAEEKTP